MKRLFVHCLVTAIVVGIAVAWPQTRERTDGSFLRRMFSGSQHPEAMIFEKTEKNYPAPGFKRILFRSEPKSSVTEEIIFPEEFQVFPIDLDIDEHKKKETKNIVFKSQDKANPIRYNTHKDGIRYYSESNAHKEKHNTKTGQQIYSKTQSNLNKEANTQGFIKFENNQPMIVWNGNVAVPNRDNTKPVLPFCVKNRIDDVIILGGHPHLVLHNHEQFTYPLVLLNNLFGYHGNPHFFLPIYREISGNVGPFETSYLPVHSFVSHSSNSASHHHSQSSFQHNSNVNIKTNNNNEVINRPGYVVPNKIGLLQTLGPMRPQYLPEHKEETKVTKNTVSGNTLSQQEKVSIEGNKPFVFKQVQNSEGGKTELVQQKEETVTNVSSNYNTNVNNKLQQTYYYVPPVIKPVMEQNVNGEDNSVKLDKFKISSVQNESVTNTSTVTQNITKTESINKVEEVLFKDQPIVVTDNHNFTHLQNNDNVTTEYNKEEEKGMDDIKTNAHQNQDRGDIPDE